MKELVVGLLSGLVFAAMLLCLQCQNTVGVIIVSLLAGISGAAGVRWASGMSNPPTPRPDRTNEYISQEAAHGVFDED